MAHIGVLKVLERAGIPVDIVTGTSMGSIVGALYAVGWNAERLDSLVRGQDWSFLLSDRTIITRKTCLTVTGKPLTFSPRPSHCRKEKWEMRPEDW